MNEDIEIEPWYKEVFHLIGSCLCFFGLHRWQGVQQGVRVHPKSQLVRIHCKQRDCDGVEYLVVED